MKKAFILMACMAALAGCAIQPRVFNPLPFDQVEYDALPKTGTGAVRGQVFAKTVGGEIKKGAGNEVRLMPSTLYRYQAFLAKDTPYLSEIPMAAAQDARHAIYDKVKTTDGDGKFEFTNIPPGKYYIVSNISWETISTNQYSRRLGLTDTQGGRVMREIEVTNGNTVEAMLSR